jgi:hypothetical protein
MDLDFTKWSSYALVKFHLYAEALWIGLLHYGPECQWSDELARQDFDPLPYRDYVDTIGRYMVKIFATLLVAFIFKASAHPA